MLARALRLSQLLELAACLALSAWLFRGHAHRAAAIAAATVAWFLGVRLALVCISSLLGWWFGSPPAPGQRIGWTGAVRMVLAEWRAFVAFNLFHLPWDRYVVRPDPPAQPDRAHAGDPRARLLRQPRLLPPAAAPPRGPRRGTHLHAQLSRLPRIDRATSPTSWSAEIERIAAGTGQAKVVLVGHSMGGLAARAYLARRGAARVARLITIASPHHGTALAVMGLGANARQMRRGSEFLATLERQRGRARARACADDLDLLRRTTTWWRRRTRAACRGRATSRCPASGTSRSWIRRAAPTRDRGAGDAPACRRAR